MGMVVRTNMAALNANNALGQASKAQMTGMQKLASGFRINKAADDASGLAISEKMKNQIKALDTAKDNCEDGANLIQTAEGYMAEAHSILERMTELSEKAANGVLAKEDRDALQDEMDQLCGEIDRMATTANFNGHKLMDGSLGSTAKVKITGQKAGEKLGFEAPTTLAPQDKLFGGTVTNLPFNGKSSAEFKFNAFQASGTNATGATATVYAWDDATGTWAASTTTINIAAKKGDTVVLDGAGTGVSDNGLVIGSGASNKGAKLTFDGSDWKTEDGTVVTGLQITGFDKLNTNDVFSAKDTSGGAVSTGINLQIGESSTAADKLEVTINSFHTDALFGDLAGKKNMENDDTNTKASAAVLTKSKENAYSTYNDNVTIDITDQDSASAAADVIRQISNYVSDERGKLGAQQNRLEHTVNNLTTASENVTASNSRIRDTDMAKEMMAYTSKNVIAQAAQSMLAQANSQPQNVLSLLQ